MAFISLSGIADTSRGVGKYQRGPHTSSRQYIVVGMGTGGFSKNGDERKSIVIRLSTALAKEARILHGDRLDLLFDKDSRLGLLKRVNKGGYAASATGKKRDEIEPSKFYSVTMKLTYYPGMPIFKAYTECENVNISDEGILFDIPNDVTY